MRILPVLALLPFLPLASKAASFTWEWKPAAGEAAPSAEVCPLKYGKEWAWTLEIDDGPSTAMSVSQPLLSRFQYTDAPPGLKGGALRPLVGSVAVMMVRVDCQNSRYLTWEDLKKLESLGWGVLNHSYWHTGNHWDPTKYLKPEQFRRELFWSQALLAAMLWDGRAASQFVYPNGDWHYGEHLKEFGIRGATHVGGKGRKAGGTSEERKSRNRNHLDEGVWAKNGDPMAFFPKAGPAPGELVIDFTHGMNEDPSSPNRKRWEERLTRIAADFGKDGADTMWGGTTEEVADYAMAAPEAKATAAPGKLTVELPDDSPGAALTVHLKGLNPSSEMKPPQGGVLHRKGDEAWVTLPRLGQPRGVPAPSPRVKRLLAGKAEDTPLSPPAPVAAVRLLQQGKLPSGPPRVELVLEDGTTREVKPGAETPPDLSGLWLLYSTVPDMPAPKAKEVRVEPNPSVKQMEIWTVAE
jgi:hypothetical protein